jgi:hypothetical protein
MLFVNKRKSAIPAPRRGQAKAAARRQTTGSAYGALSAALQEIEYLVKQLL